MNGSRILTKKLTYRHPESDVMTAQTSMLPAMFDEAQGGCRLGPALGSASAILDVTMGHDNIDSAQTHLSRAKDELYAASSAFRAEAGRASNDGSERRLPE
jgi:hypothetical protein